MDPKKTKVHIANFKFPGGVGFTCDISSSLSTRDHGEFRVLSTALRGVIKDVDRGKPTKVTLEYHEVNPNIEHDPFSVVRRSKIEGIGVVIAVLQPDEGVVVAFSDHPKFMVRLENAAFKDEKFDDFAMAVFAFLTFLKEKTRVDKEEST